MNITREDIKETLRQIMSEESDYQKFFRKALEKAGKSIPSMSDEEKKEFFNKIDKAWNGKGEKKNEGNAFGAAVTAAKEKGEDEFEVGGKTYKVESINENPALQHTMRQMGAFGGGSKKKKKVGVVPPLSDFVKDKTVKNPETKRDVKVSTAIKDKNHPAHKQAKSLWQRLKDKLKGENLSVNEGRAFVQAARKAKEEGKTEFEFNGKTYPVTLKETTISERRLGKVDLLRSVEDGETSRVEGVKISKDLAFELRMFLQRPLLARTRTGIAIDNAQMKDAIPMLAKVGVHKRLSSGVKKEFADLLKKYK
jgi:hypothetical protein